MDNEYIRGLVSVVIPTYRRSELLEKAINSVLNQTYESIELLVVNDNTRNDKYSKALYELMAHIKDDRCKLVEQEEHKNGAAARNAGIKIAKGEYIAFLDDDDFWDKTKIELQVKMLSCLDESWGGVSCYQRFYKNGKLCDVSYPYSGGDLLLKILELRINLGTGAVLIRRKALDDSGYFKENLIRNQDYQLFACLSAKYKIAVKKTYLHNRELRDGQNRPSIEQVDRIKNDFFNSIEYIMDSLPSKTTNTIYAIHKFECAYVCLRFGAVKEFLKRSLCLVKCPNSIPIILKTFLAKMYSKLFKNVLIRKYS